MKKILLLPIFFIIFFTGCATYHNLDTKSDYEYALEAVDRGDYDAGFRLLESYFNTSNPDKVINRKKALRLLETTPSLITAGQNTFTKNSFQETVNRHNGNISNAMSEEMKRLAIFQRLESFKVIKTKQYNTAFSNFKYFFNNYQKTQNQTSAKYMWSREMRDRLYALSLQMDKPILSQKVPCQGKAQLEPISTATLQPLFFKRKEKNPIKGLWTIRYKFDRCGTSSIYNAIFRANKKGPADVFPLPPGTTRASIQLMKDLKPSLFMATIAHNKNNKKCRKMIVTNSKVTLKPKSMRVNNQTFNGIWEEKWIIRTCSGKFNVDFCFIPKKSGGTTWTQSQCKPSNIATALSLNPRR